MKLRIQVSVSAVMSGLWLSVRSLSHVFRGEHGAGIEGTDEEV